ncbi:aminoacyl-tRNA hydrolase [Candidatus Daviesbacteria bacterium]|nr:aminoacyl-tRNA hydrolase [Candidatus Daviesbacteria bacterium]
MKLVVGLGNPGGKYANTRHNLGFVIIDELVKKLDLGKWTKEDKFKSEIIKTPEMVLVKPLTYINNSGLAINLLVSYYKIAPEDIILVHDELDLPLGKIKVKSGGGAAGHHGVESVINSLNTDKFTRIRIGIGPAVGPADKFVLEDFNHQERPHLKHTVKQALKVLNSLLSPI